MPASSQWRQGDWAKSFHLQCVGQPIQLVHGSLLPGQRLPAHPVVAKPVETDGDGPQALQKADQARLQLAIGIDEISAPRYMEQP